MKRINNILQNEKYKEYLRRIQSHEQDREFCKHDIGHFLDVCRLAEISEKNKISNIDTEIIYAAGLLHDVGRWQEYEEGIRHEIASAQLAEEILRGCGFMQEEIEEICLAISNHRNKEIKEDRTLSGILYRADKMSRPCFACEAEKKCDWDNNKKNLQIVY